MSAVLLAGGAFWLGVLTSVSPCPLASNLAATAWLSHRVDSRTRAITGTLAYTIGRVTAYASIAGLLALGISSAPAVSQNLQRWMTPLLGPLLVIAAMVMLGLIPLPFRTAFLSQQGAEKWAARGGFGAFALGFIFALSFCPVSAALFFGSLIPLALGSGNIAGPVLSYGIGTAAPVVLFALLMIFSTRIASKLAGGISKLQPRVLQGTGILLLMAGLYLIARDTLGLEV